MGNFLVRALVAFCAILLDVLLLEALWDWHGRDHVGHLFGLKPAVAARAPASPKEVAMLRAAKEHCALTLVLCARRQPRAWITVAPGTSVVHHEHLLLRGATSWVICSGREKDRFFPNPVIAHHHALLPHGDPTSAVWCVHHPKRALSRGER